MSVFVFDKVQREALRPCAYRPRVAASAFLMPKISEEPCEELTEILKDDENGIQDDNLSKTACEEHLARLQAEAEVQDKSRRLLVAQQQLAEHANQREEEAIELFAEARELLSAVGGDIEVQSMDPEIAARVKVMLETLCERVSQAATEAKAFAAQHREDMERNKRTSTQAELPIDGTGMDIKKPREKSLTQNGDGDLSGVEMDGKEQDLNGGNSATASSGAQLLERCKYIPLRLTFEERNRLRLLEAALNVSEYTDKVDIFSCQRKDERVLQQIKKICSTLSGLIVAQDYRHGQKLIQSRDFHNNERFFQNIFEIGRRYKIMNPDKMRTEYGKMMYMLMDSTDECIQDMLEMSCVCPLKTVGTLLNGKNALQLLQDPLLDIATTEVVAGDKPRQDIEDEIKKKETAREYLARKYAGQTGLTEEEILWCLYSISDNNSFLLFNRDPIDSMITYLKTYFKPDSFEAGCSLSISAGISGARLSHSHERQYQYVLQTLTLWREISNDMFKLWYLADLDMLDSRHFYRLTDTGQGFNRLQQSPRVRDAIHDIIDRCRQKIGHWVGSSVVHLGDHNVPNALMFIDKYTQVPRVLNPVVLVLDQIPKLYSNPPLREYIGEVYGSVEACHKTILKDCFKHAFDGSGADNFFDAGSCIDGRLTSAWNWCNRLEKKPYFHVFKLAGFIGFDGDFQK